MTLAEAISFGLDAMDLIGFAYWCFGLGHSRYAGARSRGKRHPCAAYTVELCNPVAGCVLGTTELSKRGGVMILFDDMEGVEEPTPVPTIFVTQMCRVEDAGEGMVLSSFCAPVASKRHLRARLLIPVSCGAVMNIHGTEVFARALRSYPEMARTLMRF